MEREEAERRQLELIEQEMERKTEELRVLAEIAMEGTEGGFTPKATLQRTPPQRFSTPMERLEPAGSRVLSDEDELVVREKRLLSSPEEVQEAVRRRVGAARKLARTDVPPIGGLLSRPSDQLARAKQVHHQQQQQQQPEQPREVDELTSATVEALAGLATASTKGIMEAVRAKSSKLNKEEMAAIGVHTERLAAVVMHLTLRLAAAESRVCTQAASAAPAAPLSYATALRLPSRQEPVRMDVAPGPTLAFYPAEENGALKTAEETKTELKKAIDPAKLWVQVSRVRKVGNAGVIVQTTDVESANRLRAAVPTTLRVSEPKKRQPLVCLNRLDGDPSYDEVLEAVHEQNFRDNPRWPLERIKKEATGAFKKNRGSRGVAPATSVVFSCTAEMREALLQKGRVYVGWQAVEVTDYVDVTCCNKCQQYGHPERHCRSKEITCGRCGGTGHRAEECKAAASCCATCKRLGKKGAADHRTASRDCPARQYAAQRSVSMTSYGS